MKAKTKKKAPAKKKVVAKKVIKATPKVVKKATPKKTTTTKAVEKKVKVPVVLPKYDNKQVTKVISHGHTKTHYLCAGRDGDSVVKFHVPRKIIERAMGVGKKK